MTLDEIARRTPENEAALLDGILRRSFIKVLGD